MPQYNLFKNIRVRTQIFITPQDIMMLDGKTLSTAYRTIDKIRAALDKPRKSKITVFAYCEYHAFNEAETKEVLTKLGFDPNSL